jgi:hypothetical protein
LDHDPRGWKLPRANCEWPSVANPRRIARPPWPRCASTSFPGTHRRLRLAVQAPEPVIS